MRIPWLFVVLAWLGWGTRRARYDCLHHNRRTGETWVQELRYDGGKRTVLECTRCGDTWR